MNMNVILDYLNSLDQNNNREWFHENKEQYLEAVAAFEDLVGRLIPELKKTDDTVLLAQPKELTFKLTRDTRFSHDKSPYNPAFRAHIAPKGKLPIPVGYYFMIRPGNRSFLGGGLFADMFKDATAMVRDAIAANGPEWESIVTSPEFTRLFTVGGTKLKKVPVGYDPAHPQAEFLKHKSWYLEYPISDQRLTEPGFVDYAAGVFEKMRPFNAFLNRALAGFQMPER